MGLALKHFQQNLRSALGCPLRNLLQPGDQALAIYGTHLVESDLALFTAKRDVHSRGVRPQSRRHWSDDHGL